MENKKNKSDISLLQTKKQKYSFGQIIKTVPVIGTVFINSPQTQLITSLEAVRMAKKLIIDQNKEHFIAIYLCPTRKKPECELISLGTLTASIVHPREIFRPAIKYNATAIIVLHNHPSSDVSPSESDIELTKRLKNAGRLLGIEVLDHLIFERGNRFYSFNKK